MNRRIRNILITTAALSGLATPAIVSAAATPNLTQTVNNGALSANIYQSDDVTPVASPSVAFTALNRSFSCQTSTATMGDTNNKLGVTNFDSSDTTGWTLTMAATGGASATWTSGSDTYKFNDATGSGCTNGQLTVDASGATITTDCSGVCTGVTVNKGSSTAMTSSTPVGLMTTSSGSAWKGYMTGVSLSQKIPAMQVSGSYSIGMTVTATAN